MSLRPSSRRSPEFLAVKYALSEVTRRGIVVSHVARAALRRAKLRAGDNLAGKTATEKALIKAVGAMKVNVKKWASATTVDDLLAADAIAAMDVALAAAALRLTRPGKPCDVDELAAKFAAELVGVAEIKELRAAEAQHKREHGHATTTTRFRINGAGQLVERTRTDVLTPEQVATRARLQQERKDQPLEERNPDLHALWTAEPGATPLRDHRGKRIPRVNPKDVIKTEGAIKLHRDGTFSVLLKHATRKVKKLYFSTREEALEHQAELRRQGVLPEPPAKRLRRRVLAPASTDQRVRQSARVAGEQAPPVPVVVVRPSDLVVRCRCGPAYSTCPSCPAHPDVVKVGGPGNWHVAG